MRFVGLLTFALLAALALPATASRWTEEEIKALPDYCQARINSKSAEHFNNWRSTLGPDFEHTHHYCYGLIYLNRYYRTRTSLEKKRVLQSAQSNFVYVIQRANPSFPILPDVYMSMGAALALQNNDGEALQAMLKALELNPKLAKAYVNTANHYVKLKKNGEALKLTAEGLRQIPGNSSLQRLYVKLGGKLPYPEPPAPQENIPAEEAATKEGDVGAGAQAAQPEVQVPASESLTGPVAGETKEADAATPPKIGSPSNPWCRFCPPEPGQ